jgi:predicted HTH domain antitoxin
MKFSIEDIVEDLTELDLAILHLLHADNNNPLKGKVAFQKEMFLIADYIENIREKAEFIPHTFGPYSEAAENEMGNLRALGLVEEQGHEYHITPTGVAALGKAESVFSGEDLDAIQDFKKFLNDLTEDELLLFVYVSYPDYKEESAVYERVIRKRIPTAIALYKKGKVSLEKAAFLAGLPVEKFLDKVRG